MTTWPGTPTDNDEPSTATGLARVVLAESYAAASFAEKVLPVQATTAAGRRRLNYTAHFAFGGMWGTAHGLRGQEAVNTVFAVVYTGDVLLDTALGLYQPSKWTARDWSIDLVEKHVQAQAAVFGRVLDPPRQF